MDEKFKIYSAHIEHYTYYFLKSCYHLEIIVLICTKNVKYHNTLYKMYYSIRQKKELQYYPWKQLYRILIFKEANDLQLYNKPYKTIQRATYSFIIDFIDRFMASRYGFLINSLIPYINIRRNRFKCLSKQNNGIFKMLCITEKVQIEKRFIAFRTS